MKFDIYSYRFAEEVLNSDNRIKNELFDIIKSTEIKAASSLGTELNKAFQTRFVEKGWEKQVEVIPKHRLTADFRKNRIQVEVQFGNIARSYTDLLKFQVSFLEGLVDVGIELLPKIKLANVIASGVANFEKMKKEIELFKTVITLPILLIGVEL